MQPAWVGHVATLSDNPLIAACLPEPDQCLPFPASRDFLAAWFLMSTVQGTLENCSQKLKLLSGSIDRIRSISTGSSLSDPVAPPPTPASPVRSSPNMSGKRAAARCHECHGPLAGYHQGYQHGLGQCQLQHYDLCPGGVQEKDRGGH